VSPRRRVDKQGDLDGGLDWDLPWLGAASPRSWVTVQWRDTAEFIMGPSPTPNAFQIGSDKGSTNHKSCCKTQPSNPQCPAISSKPYLL
jgi:hypothetical protein